jgi:hypothetical protein
LTFSAAAEEFSIAYDKGPAHDSGPMCTILSGMKFPAHSLDPNSGQWTANPPFSHNPQVYAPKPNWSSEFKRCNMNYYWHQHDTNEKASNTSPNQDVPDDIRNPSFHQIATTSWSTQRHLPPSPIQTTNSFEGYETPLPVCTNAYDPRGTKSHAPAKNIFEGYYEHPAPRYPFEAVEANYFSPTPFPVHPEGGIHTYEGPSADCHPYVSHTLYWFDPHLPSSTWHTMYKADPTADRKPSPLNLTSPIHPLFDYMDPEPSPEANVPPVASAIAPLLSSAVEESSTKRKPANKRKKKAAPRRARPLSERGNHQHASTSQEELDQVKTSRAKKAMASWYERYNELVDYTNDFGDSK